MPVTINERFPVTLGLLILDAFALITLPFLALSVDVTPDLSAKSVILLVMFLTGTVLLLITSVAFSRSTDTPKDSLGLVKPEKVFEPFTPIQAILVVLGFGIVGAWQLYVNQAFITPAITVPLATAPASTTVDIGTAITFAVDNAIAEEALLGAFTIFVYLTGRYFGLGKGGSAVTAIAVAGGFFTWLHKYVYGTAPQALIFVFGARVVLSSVLLGTLYFSRSRVHPTAALAAPPLIHITWNLGTVIG